VTAHEAALLTSLLDGLASVGARVHRIWPDSGDRVPVVTFTVDHYPAALVAAYLSAEHGIGVRDGKFCAHPLLARLGVPTGAVRASLGLGSQPDDVGRLIAALRQLRDSGPAWTYGEDCQPSPDTRPLPDWAGGTVPASPCGLWPVVRAAAPRGFPGNPHHCPVLPLAYRQRWWRRLRPDRLGPALLRLAILRPALL
jgi:hypothetical protein